MEGNVERGKRKAVALGTLLGPDQHLTLSPAAHVISSRRVTGTVLVPAFRRTPFRYRSRVYSRVYSGVFSAPVDVFLTLVQPEVESADLHEDGGRGRGGSARGEGKAT